VKRTAKGFTLVELLTTVGIIAILVTLLMPAVNMVRKMAKEAEQKAQFNTIGMGLEAFKSDMGKYPESKWLYYNSGIRERDYQGAQRLSEALVGWDLLGVHPDTAWKANGWNEDNSRRIYPQRPINTADPDVQKNLDERLGVYLDNPTEHAFKLCSRSNNVDDGLFYPRDFPGAYYSNNIQNTFVLCDVFKERRINLVDPLTSTITNVTVKAGTPILYYKADLSSKQMSYAASLDPTLGSRYNVSDNIMYMNLPPLSEVGKTTVTKVHKLGNDPALFYNTPQQPQNSGATYGVIDMKVPTLWPHRPDSYILISAGWDGLYGTSDDIFNF